MKSQQRNSMCKRQPNGNYRTEKYNNWDKQKQTINLAGCA